MFVCGPLKGSHRETVGSVSKAPFAIESCCLPIPPKPTSKGIGRGDCMFLLL